MAPKRVGKAARTSSVRRLGDPRSWHGPPLHRDKADSPACTATVPVRRTGRGVRRALLRVDRRLGPQAAARSACTLERPRAVVSPVLCADPRLGHRAATGRRQLARAFARPRVFSTIVKALDSVASQDIVQVALTAKEHQRQSEARGHWQVVQHRHTSTQSRPSVHGAG